MKRPAGSGIAGGGRSLSSAGGLLSFDMRGLFLLCSSVTTFPGIAFVLSEFFLELPQTLRVCVFHRGVVLLGAVYLFVQQAAFGASLQVQYKSKAFVLLFVLAVLVGFWESLNVSVYFCATWSPVIYVYVGLRLMRASVLAHYGAAWPVVLHATVAIAVITSCWYFEWHNLLLTAINLSSLAFAWELARAMPSREFIICPGFLRFLVQPVPAQPAPAQPTPAQSIIHSTDARRQLLSPRLR